MSTLAYINNRAIRIIESQITALEAAALEAAASDGTTGEITGDGTTGETTDDDVAPVNYVYTATGASNLNTMGFVHEYIDPSPSEGLPVTTSHLDAIETYSSVYDLNDMISNGWIELAPVN
jgi:hypothetical protein